MSTKIYTSNGKILINGSNGKWKRAPYDSYYLVILDYTNTSTSDNLATAYNVSPQPFYASSGAISNWINPSGQEYEMKFYEDTTTIGFTLGSMGSSTITPPTVRLYKVTSGVSELLDEQQSYAFGRTFSFDLTSYT